MPGKSKEVRGRGFQLSEDECTRSEAFLAAVLNSFYDHVAVVNRDGTIIAVNDAWRRFARENDAKSPAVLAEGINYLKVCREVSDEESEYAGRALKGLEGVIGGKQEIFEMEYPCSSPQEERWFAMTVVPLKRPEGGVVVIHTDITRRRGAEEKLYQSQEYLEKSQREYQELARNLISDREDARRRLARELHDSFSQRMALISMLAGKMELEQKDNPDLRDVLNRIQREMSRLSRDVHDIARQLHPRILDDLGLADAVKSLCSSFTGNEGIPVEVKVGEIPSGIPGETSLNLYRIIQESLSNIAKHAQAEQAVVDLDVREDKLRLSIRDDGVGFDLREGGEKKGLGLVSMRERVALIGGSIDIWSADGSGTRIFVEVPLSMA